VGKIAATGRIDGSSRSRDFAHAVEPRGPDRVGQRAQGECARGLAERARCPPYRRCLRALAPGQPLVHVHHKGDTKTAGFQI